MGCTSLLLCFLPILERKRSAQNVCTLKKKSKHDVTSKSFTSLLNHQQCKRNLNFHRIFQYKGYIRTRATLDSVGTIVNFLINIVLVKVC